MKKLLRQGMMFAIILALAISPVGCADTHKSSHALSDSVPTGSVSIQSVFADLTLVATVHPIEVMDDYAVLTIDYSVLGDAESSDELLFYQDASKVRIVDTKTGRVWLAGHASGLSDTTRGFIASRDRFVSRKHYGASKTATTLFPLMDTNTVDVLIPFLGFAYNVPVVSSSGETQTIESLGLDFDVAFPEPMFLSSFVQTYDADKAIDTSEDTQAPAANTPVATGHNSVEYTINGMGSKETVTLIASVSSVRRHGDWLVGSVTVTKVSWKKYDAQSDVLGSMSNLTQQEYKYDLLYSGAQSVTLLTSDGRLFPAQYTVSTREKSGKTVPVVDILADRYDLSDIFRLRDSVIFTVVWPDTGQDAVTIDVPDRFRITDIPVEGR